MTQPKRFSVWWAVVVMIGVGAVIHIVRRTQAPPTKGASSVPPVFVTTGPVRTAPDFSCPPPPPPERHPPGKEFFCTVDLEGTTASRKFTVSMAGTAETAWRWCQQSAPDFCCAALKSGTHERQPTCTLGLKDAGGTQLHAERRALAAR